jgi:hypothetical protein
MEMPYGLAVCHSSTPDPLPDLHSALLGSGMGAMNKTLPPCQGLIHCQPPPAEPNSGNQIFTWELTWRINPGAELLGTVLMGHVQAPTLW